MESAGGFSSLVTVLCYMTLFPFPFHLSLIWFMVVMSSQIVSGVCCTSVSSQAVFVTVCRRRAQGVCYLGDEEGVGLTPEKAKRNRVGLSRDRMQK